MDKEKAKQIIRTRTSKIVGGYITEILFSRMLDRQYPDLLYSRGWWGGIENAEEHKLVFFAVKETLNELDYLLINRLEAYGYEWKQVSLQNGHIIIKDSNSTWSRDEFVKKRAIKASHDPNVDRKPRYDDPNMDKCLQFYEKAGMLNEIATSIFIEDHFLNAFYTISNIDFICRDNKGNPFYVEVKFKNEFKKLCKDGITRLVFGIDEFQYDYLFDAFYKCGMHVTNVILYNDSKDTSNTSSTVIFDYMKNRTEEEYLWRRAVIKMDAQYERFTVYAKHTSWYSNSSRTVYCVPLTDYSNMKNSCIIERRTHATGWGKCPKCGGEKVIRRNKRTGIELFVCNQCGELFEYMKK